MIVDAPKHIFDSNYFALEDDNGEPLAWVVKSELLAWKRQKL